MATHAHYLTPSIVADIRKRTVERVTKYLREFKRTGKIDFNGIAVCGVSGAGIGYPVAFKMGLDVAHVRKPGAKNHSERSVEYTKNTDKVIIIDDFISSGATISRMVRCLHREGIKVVAVVEYSRYSDTPAMMKTFEYLSYTTYVDRVKECGIQDLPVFRLGVSHEYS